MVRKVILTKDGSHTIAIPGMNVTCHSVNGAIQESRHVYIEAGLRYASGQLNPPETLYVLEMGFGTGLNALLTLAEAEKTNQKIYYTAIELYPLKQEEASALNYCEQVSQPDLNPLFDKFHICEWEKEVGITLFFTLFKNKQSFLDFETEKLGHLIYFDAFAPSAQPELWAKEVFEKIYKTLFPDGVLVTYCSKGDVRRAMIKAGFSVEKIQGPPGKREMLRAVKL